MFFIYSPVCRVPKKNRGDFLTALLGANLFSKETGGFAHFGLDETSGEVLLFARFDIEKIAYDEFVAALEMFLDRVAFWTRQAGVLMEESYPAEEGGNRNWALRV